MKPSDTDKTKELLCGQIQSSSEATHGREKNNAVQRQQLERGKAIRRSKPVKAKVVAHTKENSG